jgi:hypothetical protein
MKKLIMLLLMVCFVLAFPFVVMAEDKDNGEDPDQVQVKLKVGAVVKDGQDFQGKVNEYKPVDDGVRPVIKAKISGRTGKTYFNLFSDFRGDLKDQYHQLEADFNRVLTQKFSFDSIYHRLDHDPLTNIDVVSEARSAAYVEDFNPADQYHITRNEFLSTTRLSIPQLPFLKMYVHFRNENRVGEYQARTLSKCSACHVVAKSRPIDNFNRDIRIGGFVRMGKANIDYSFTHNQFKEKETAPTNHYLKVQHPELSSPVFTARISYGDDQVLPFDNIPESKKDTHLVKAAVPISDSSTISAQYLDSTVKNVTAGLQWASNSFAGAFSTRFGKKGFFNIRFQQIKITNDSIFIDLNEPVDIGGPLVGTTYAEDYGVGTFDFTRYSAMSRTVWDIDANFRYRLSKQVRLRLGYEYKQIDREHYDVDNTKYSTFKGQLSFRPVKQFKLTLDGMYRTISNPFANLKGGVAPTVQTTAYPNPFVGVQFFQWHALREATLTNYPESIKELKAGFNWNASARFALNGNFLYRNEENDNLIFPGARWDRDMTQWGVNMWLAPSQKFPITVSYYNYQNKYDTLFAIAALEGCGAGIIGGMTGTLTDMMGYDINNQTVLINLSYLASKKLSLSCGFNYNDSLAEIKDLVIDTSQVPFLPGSGGTALNFDNYGGIAQYSKLNMKQMIAELGFKFSLSKQWWLNGAFYYYFYDDLAEYLFTDTTGKSYSFFAGFTWMSK